MSRDRERERGRITPVDVVFIAVSAAALAFLAEPFYTLMAQNSLGAGTTLLFQMLIPSLAAMILFVTYRTALLGGSS